jgi:excisionase family DNA binding protein
MATLVADMNEIETLLRRIVREELGKEEDVAVTKAEAAARLNVSVRTIDRRIKDGTLPTVKLGGAIRIPISAVLRA